MPTTTKSQQTAKSPVTKKAVTKKVTAKKPTAQAAGLKVMVYASDHESFWTTDGQILNSLLALHEALKTMDKNVYDYHVKAERHDFANWVAAVLGDEMCASDLRSCKTKAAAKTAVARHLKLYSL